MTTIRTCILTFDGKGFLFESLGKATPVQMLVKKMQRAGYNYYDRKNVLFVTSFEILTKQPTPTP